MSSPTNQELMFALTSEETARRTKQADPLETLYVNHARVAGGYMDVRIFLWRTKRDSGWRTNIHREFFAVLR